MDMGVMTPPWTTPVSVEEAQETLALMGADRNDAVMAGLENENRFRRPDWG